MVFLAANAAGRILGPKAGANFRQCWPEPVGPERRLEAAVGRNSEWSNWAAASSSLRRPSLPSPRPRSTGSAAWR